MMLPPQRILLEELHDWRIRPERLDQLDLRIRRIDKADSNPLRGQVERIMHHRGFHPFAVQRDGGFD